MRSKLGASGSGATGAPFLVVVTILIIFYIIFLPPSDRAALLDSNIVPGSNTGGTGGTGGTGSTTNSGSVGSDFIFKGPGELVSADQTQFDHSISPLTLEGLSQTKTVMSSPNTYVSASIFESQKKTLTFSNTQIIESPVFTVSTKGQGRLSIVLNGQEIYNGEPNSYVGPIALDANLIRATNELTFSVSSPPFAFWQKNEYELADVKITATTLDSSRLIASQLFDVREVETQNLQSSRVRFVADCGADHGTLQIKINGQTIYNQIPDCGQLNLVSLSNSILLSGQNQITFSASGGRYLLDRIAIQTFLDTDKPTTYYFSLDEKLFTYTAQKNPVCGDIDGYCPAGCSADVDKDCCFREYDKAFWCDVPTQLNNDRCVGRVDTFNWDRCPSGYKDDSEDVPTAFRGKCGDDNDGFCPAGCSMYYDKNCCLGNNSKNYWCSDLPTGGVVNKCKAELSVDEYGFCPANYDSNDGTVQKPKPLIDPEYRDVVLNSGVRVFAEFTLVADGTRHEADLNINGYKMALDTTSGTYVLDISRYVKDNNNYIQITPQTDLNLVQTRISVQKR